MSAPPVVVGVRDAALARALDGGGVVALPFVGSYVLAARGDRPAAVARLLEVAPGAAGAPRRLLIGDTAQARRQAGSWSDDVQRLVDRCWPGPLTIEVEAASREATVALSMPTARPLRRLCRSDGPLVMAAVPMTAAGDVVASGLDLACVVDGGPCRGPGPTVVDCSVVPPTVVGEGALPSVFIEATMLMRSKRRWFGRVSGG